MKKFLIYSLSLFFVFCGLFFSLILFYPEPESLNVQSINESSKIYDRNGKLLYEILIPQKGKQNFLALVDMSSSLPQAVVALEDQDFYQHHGVDFSALARAMWQNFYYGEVVSGASTLEQQLARNLLNHQERSFGNKIKEICLALNFNLKYDKNQILEKYLNTVYFGNLAYGAETAAQIYFGKSAAKLDWAESAYLAGLPQAPSRYSPYVDFLAGKKRQEQVLEILFQQGKINQPTYLAAKAEKLQFQPQKIASIKAPHFTQWILRELEKKGILPQIAQGNYRITTTLDLGLQEKVENLVNVHLKHLAQKQITNAAVVVLGQKTGEVLAMVGSQNYFDAKIDGAVNVALALRQPGSALKPFLYALAFSKGFTPDTTIIDEKVQFRTIGGHPYEPKNYDLLYHGKVTLREALAQSLNIPAVKLLHFLGVPPFLQFLKHLGITTLNQDSAYYGLSLILGSGEVSLLELTQAYGVLGNAGRAVSARGILAITAINANPLELQTPWRENSAMLIEPKEVVAVTSILNDNYARLPAFGEDNPLKFAYPVAAKTGTSRNFRDNWALGYTPLRTVGVWVGNSDGSEMLYSSGITGAAPLFHSVMDATMENLPRQNFDFSILQKSAKAIKSFEEFVQQKSISTGANDLNRPAQNLILYPFDGDVFQLSSEIPLEKQVLFFKARQVGIWSLNDAQIGTGEKLAWQLQKDKFVLKFTAQNQTETIHFAVR